MHELLSDFKIQARAMQKRRQRRRFVALSKILICLACIILSYQFNVIRLVTHLNDESEIADAGFAVPNGEQISFGGNFAIDTAEQMRDPVFLFRDVAGKQSKNKFEIRFQKASTAVAQTDGVFYVSDRMMGSSVRLMTALPALPQDFALMGTTSVDERILAAGGLADEIVERGTATDFTMQGGAGWDELVGGGGSDASLANTFKVETASKFGSSSVFVLLSTARKEVSREFVVKTLFVRDLAGMLVETGVAELSAKAAADAAAKLLNIRTMQSGYLVALRLEGDTVNGEPRRIVQLSLFDTRGLIGSLGLSEDDTYSAVEDPWKKEWLASYTKDSTLNPTERRYRIMDGIYSAGLRNDIPPHIISETIMQMARAYNIGQFIQSSDKFSIIYSETARQFDSNDGHVLYASVTHNDETLSCYVLKPSVGGDFTCMTDKDTVTERLGPSGFVTPVNGVLRSGFGPRVHPILGGVRLHEGVDWAAPPGTPVVAAFEGTIQSAAVNRGYGNFIKIAHPNGLATGYAHLSEFAKDVRVGKVVRAGEVIGFVGSTGQSTGPHLHFELYVDGRPVDPLNFSTETALDTPPGEVDKLVQRIINVESGGSTNAKNPLSSATGLGQFIDETWLRMIRSYRPDIANSMNRDDLLSLRFDPSLSREMVYNLANENEADIRRAGHAATAGNLYLAHFLGSAGAVTVMNAAPDEAIEAVVGNDVVSANPFLHGKSTSWIINWAARKMTGRNSIGFDRQARLPEAARIKNSRFKNYSEAIDKMLASITQSRQGS
jgi:murein DD-endopeptidase MepM/ murein hydrolase activator NlpD